MPAPGRLEGTLLRGTDGAFHPFFSADGKWIGFLTPGQVKKVSPLGGPVVTLSSLGAGTRGASWGSDDTTIVVATTSGLFRVPAAGGDATPLLPIRRRRLAAGGADAAPNVILVQDWFEELKARVPVH
jgi:hypothetical protein